MKHFVFRCAIISLTGLGLLCGCGQGDTSSLKRARPGKNLEAAMGDYLKGAEEQGLNIQSVMVLQHGKVLYEKWWNGGEAQTPHVLNSVSKTFTSAAVGLAIGEGLLSLDDTLVSFFPDDLPENPSENLEKVTVRHLLTMNSGHDSEPRRDQEGQTWVQSFLSWPVVHEPGTYYCYNSLGTYMLSRLYRR